MLVVEEAHDSSLPGAGSAATVAPVASITAASAATSLTPASSVDPAALTDAAIDAVACGLAPAPFASYIVASFAEVAAPPPRDVGPPPTAECMVCNMVTLPQPMWHCNICKRTTCAECVQEHTCGCAGGFHDTLTIVRHPHEMLFQKLYNLHLGKAAAGPLEAIAEVCEGMLQVNAMLREDEGDDDDLDLKASEEFISLHISRDAITPPPTCATSFVAGKRSPSASRAGSPKSCTSRKLSFS